MPPFGKPSTVVGDGNIAEIARLGKILC